MSFVLLRRCYPLHNNVEHIRSCKKSTMRAYIVFLSVRSHQSIAPILHFSPLQLTPHDRLLVFPSSIVQCYYNDLKVYDTWRGIWFRCALIISVYGFILFLKVSKRYCPHKVKRFHSTVFFTSKLVTASDKANYTGFNDTFVFEWFEYRLILLSDSCDCSLPLVYHYCYHDEKCIVSRKQYMPYFM